MNLKDRIYTECITVGTGNIKVGGVKDGFQDWTSLNDGDAVYYCIVDDLAWEVGEGVYIAEVNEVTRNKVLSSSTGDKLVLDGLATAFATYPADKAVIRDLNNNIHLPNSNALLKYINGLQVTAPAVITEAVIVDGEAGADGDLAGLLNVYRKDEIDEQQEKQDIQIEENKQDIIELEEEIDAIAPTFDRGQWDYEAPSNPLGSPAEGTYFTLNENEVISNDFANTAEIIFHNKDVLEATHTWAGVEAGQYIELFDTIDSEFLLAEIDEVTLETGYVKFAVTPKQFEGGPSGINKEGDHRVRIKIFELPETDVTTLMPKAGGTFTGKVKHKKDIDIEPTLPSRFVTVKNFYATKADGSSAGAEGTNFGLNFDLDHGNSGYNTVKWTTRDGDILKVNGGADAAVKYTGKITNDKHIVNKEYVDSVTGGLHTLTSAGNTMKYITPRNLASNQFGANSPSMGTAKLFYFHQLYNSSGAIDYANNYEATEATMLEIWVSGELITKTGLKEWKESMYNSSQRQANISGYKPVTYGSDLNTNYSYGIVLSGLKKI